MPSKGQTRPESPVRGICAVLGFLLAAVVAPSPAMASDAETCVAQHGGALASACADPSLAGLLDALIVVEGLTGEGSKGTGRGRREEFSSREEWHKAMRSCGQDRTCLWDGIARRQRQLNAMRLRSGTYKKTVEVADQAQSSPIPLQIPSPIRTMAQDDKDDVVRTLPDSYVQTALPPSSHAPGESVMETGAEYGSYAVLVSMGLLLGPAAGYLCGNRKGRRSRRKGCPECGADVSREIVPTDARPFERRRGRYREITETRPEKVRSGCGCRREASRGIRLPIGQDYLTAPALVLDPVNVPMLR